MLLNSGVIGSALAKWSIWEEEKYFTKTLYLIFDYPYKYYTFKHFEV